MAKTVIRQWKNAAYAPKRNPKKEYMRKLQFFPAAGPIKLAAIDMLRPTIAGNHVQWSTRSYYERELLETHPCYSHLMKYIYKPGDNFPRLSDTFLWYPEFRINE